MTLENKKSSPINISVTLKESTVEQIRKMALSSCRSVQNTIIFLANTALKYNYTEDYRYIPCKPQRGDIRIGKERNYTINIRISSSLNKRLSFLMQANFIENRSKALRSLIETALIYDYNKNLLFRKPQKLSVLSQKDNNKSNDIIMLDII